MKKFVPFMAAAFFSAAFVFQARTPSSTLARAPEVSWPDRLGGREGFNISYCQNEQCMACFVGKDAEIQKCTKCGSDVAFESPGEKKVLPSDTIIHKRGYRDANGTSYVVSAVIGGASKRSIHRPELCMPAQGFIMSNPYDVKVNGRPFRVITLSSGNVTSAALAYTFFNQDGVKTSSHIHRIFTDTWDRSVMNRIDRWVMVTVRADFPGGFEAGNPFIRHELERVLGAVSEVLP